jgi:SAM-dependent methyltransferase
MTAVSSFRLFLQLVYGDPMVLDRWRWIHSRLPAVPADILDAGCGSGAFSMLLSRYGHRCVGLSISESEIHRASDRASALCPTAPRFEVQDLRTLAARGDLEQEFDLVLCLETIEHIIDDENLVRHLARALRPGGKLVITTPNSAARYLKGDQRTFSPVEDGSHVRRGYSASDLQLLCTKADLQVLEVGGCSGLTSQRLTELLRDTAERVGYGWAWIITFLLRLVPPLVDPFFRRLMHTPDYSVCIVATRPFPTGTN